MKRPAALLLGAFILAGCASYSAGPGSNYLPSGATYTLGQDEITIRAVLKAQAAAWNRGDIDGFLTGYWQSDELRFASGGDVTKGYDRIAERYRTNYSSTEAMGRLTFAGLEVDQISEDAAIVHGRWSLAREADAPSGLFTLVFKQINGEWLIVSDTTTSAE